MDLWTTPPETLLESMVGEGIGRAWVLADPGTRSLQASHELLEPVRRAVEADERDYHGHRGMFLGVGEESGHLLTAFIHRTCRGQAAGGVRFWPYPTLQELVRDGHAGDLSSPQAQLVQGLLALRGGRYQEAESHLAGSARRPDGAQLYFRALANLSIPGEVARARAMQLFGELLRSYPDSPLSLYVESFLAQLSL